MTLLSMTLLSMTSLTACRDLVGNANLPAGTEEPSTYDTPAGALAQAASAQYLLQRELMDYVLMTGYLTDEFTITTKGTGITGNASENALDTRELPEGNSSTSINASGTYTQLQRLRGQARQARGMLAKYAPAVSPAVRARLYAYEAYADILLADLFCSGIPLSTLDFEKDFTYQPGSSTADVYQQAVMLLDTAETLAADSPSVQTLIQVSRGRALLGMGQYDQAAAAVASVATGDAYHLKVLFSYTDLSRGSGSMVATMSDAEGGNGLLYRSGDDPRTAWRSLFIYTSFGYTATNYPNKYNGFRSGQIHTDTIPVNSVPDSIAFTMGDWIEARLIQAEAALHDGDVQGWADILNSLRATAGPTLTPAIGVIPPLPADSTTNASAALRVDVLFHERAFWLFFTGHRNGDLRRLIRQYGRVQDQVYPAGTYLNGSSTTGLYGTDVAAPIPATESINPLFHGCLNRDA
jgi:hypothetical protein